MAIDTSVLGHTREELDAMPHEERKATLVELLNQSVDLLEQIASAFEQDLITHGEGMEVLLPRASDDIKWITRRLR